MLQKLNSYTAFFLLAALLYAITWPALFSDGMFMDGTIYAAVAHNMANGLGSFWQPHFSQTLFPEFYQHPPLAMGLQAIFFKLFGDSYLIERFYSLSTFLISGLLIGKIWIEIGNTKHSAWLPLLFWIANPLILWAVSNNMLENTLQIFVLAAVFALCRSIKKNSILWVIVAGLLLFLGLLTKGLVALFPLSFFFWLWLFKAGISFRNMLFKTTLISISTILPLILLILFNENAFYALSSYYNKQIVFSLSDVQTVSSRFFIIGRLFNELIISFGFILALLFILRKKFKIFKLGFSKNSKSIYTFLALGFSGVLPIMISLKQSGFYMIPAFPFFALALALIIKPLLETQKRSNLLKYSGIISLVILSIALFVSSSSMGKIGRDKELLEDVYAISKVVPHASKISISKNLAQNWSLHAYFSRYSNISLDDIAKVPTPYYLTNSEISTDLSIRYKKSDLKLNGFMLYQLKQD